MSWQCTSWALREAPAPTSTARLVLIALADRCQPDGRSAWPTVDTLAREAHTSVPSVRRALKALEECGAIRRGNQLLAQWDEHGQWTPEQYRPIVWECCMNVTLEHIVEKPGRQARAEREQRLGQDRPSDTTNRHAAQKARNEAVSQTYQNDRSGKPTKKQTYQNDRPRPITGDTPRPITGDTPIRRTNKQTNNPSAPTGHLPASGAIRRREETNETGNTTATPKIEAGPSDADASDDAMLVAANLNGLRAEWGLDAKPSTRGDLDAIRRLLARLKADGVANPLGVLTETLEYAFRPESTGWWPKRVKSGRSFARDYERIREDMTIASHACAKAMGTPATATKSNAVAERSTARGPVVDPHVERARLLLEGVGPDQGNDGVETIGRLAQLLAEHDDPRMESECVERALREGRERVERRRRDRERHASELDEFKRAHGGWGFQGNWTRDDNGKAA